MSAALVAAICVGSMVVLGGPPRPTWPGPSAPPVAPDPGWLVRHRLLWSCLSAGGGLAFLGGTGGLVLAPVVGTAVWVLVGRAETPAVRRRREAVRRDLPHVVTLLAAALRAGAGPTEAVGAVSRALPGPAGDRLATIAVRVALGSDAAGVWAELARDPELGPLGRTLARAQRTGAPVVPVVERLADELARSGRSAVEDRARAVGVKAAVPLGLCLLPAFVLIGIVPLVAALLGSLAW